MSAKKLKNMKVKKFKSRSFIKRKGETKNNYSRRGRAIRRS